MKRWMVVASCAAALLLPACRHAPSDLASGTGTMLVTGDCHAWHVKADSGRYFEVRELPSEFQQSDLRVRFTVRERPDLASACMLGTIADVVSMTRL